jgi:hypothetical protein
MGIGLFFKIHNRKNHRLGKKPIRFFHRYLGISLSVFILLWVFSGFYHVWHKKPELVNIQPIFHTQDLNPEAWQLAVQRRFSDSILYRSLLIRIKLMQAG